jgi:IMP cyclohydrolase
MELENIAKMEYPGRIIIIGRDITGENEIAVYGITGRSPSSQARKLKFDGTRLLVQPTNKEELKKGNPDLLIYPAIAGDPYKGLVISNGKQTASIESCIKAGEEPFNVFKKGLDISEWQYEPDAPNYTPRISGYIIPHGGSALSIIKRSEDGSPIRYDYNLELEPGKGKFIATYTGENKNPLPSFEGEPIDVELKGKTPNEIADAVYEALGPRDVEKDFRVGVAAIFYNTNKNKWVVAVKNRCDLE